MAPGMGAATWASLPSSALRRTSTVGLALRLIGAEAVVDDFVVLVNAALHLGFAAAHRHGKGG